MHLHLLSGGEFSFPFLEVAMVSSLRGAARRGALTVCCLLSDVCRLPLDLAGQCPFQVDVVPSRERDRAGRIPAICTGVGLTTTTGSCSSWRAKES